MRVGVEMVSALVVAVAIGWGLDWLLGTRPILTAVFVLLGGAAGVLNVWRVFAPKRTPRGDTGCPPRGGAARTGDDRVAAGTGSIDALGQFKLAAGARAARRVSSISPNQT